MTFGRAVSSPDETVDLHAKPWTLLLHAPPGLTGMVCDASARTQALNKEKLWSMLARCDSRGGHCNQLAAARRCAGRPTPAST